MTDSQIMTPSMASHAHAHKPMTCSPGNSSQSLTGNSHYVCILAVRERVKPLFLTRMRLGEFDPPSMNPYLKINDSQILSRRHRDLAKTAAIKSFVLLKNEEKTLPISDVTARGFRETLV